MARELLAKLEPSIAESANARSKLEESVRKQPLLASFRRRRGLPDRAADRPVQAALTAVSASS